jgi:nicotinate phosphoribosyltransferase
VDNVIRLAQELGDDFRARAIRLDSGDLAALAHAARRRLDDNGLTDVRIVASGGLDEHSVRALVDAGAPIDGFGVGTAMGVSQDEPSLDMVYKLAEYAGRGRVKTSPGKPVLPGRKQVFRIERAGIVVEDVIARHDEEPSGTPLLRPVMNAGARVEAARETIDAARERAARETARLPAELRGLDRPARPFPVRVSGPLGRHHTAVIEAGMNA